MGLQLPHYVYFTLLYVPIGLAFVIWLAILVGTVLFSQCKKLWNKPVPSILTGSIKFTFIGNLFQEEIGGTNTRRYVVFNYTVSPRLVRTLGSISFMIWLSMFVSFWSTFLLGISHSCVSNIDCFFTNNNSLVDSCETVDPSSAIDAVYCFTFNLALINALGNAGGLQTLLTSIIHGQLAMYIWLKKRLSQTKVTNKYKWKILAVFLILVPFALGLIVIALGIVNFVLLFREHNTPIQDYIILLLFVLTLLACTSLPLYLINDK